MQGKRQITTTMAAIALLLSLLVAGPRAFAQASTPPSLVEVYWQSSKTVVAPGITNLIILDPDIARAETGYDTIQFFGLQRGETVALGYVNDKPVSIRVRVMQRPPLVISPGTLRRQSEMAQGMVSTTAQITDSNGLSTLTFVNGFSWSQLAGNDGHLDINMQVDDNNTPGGHAFNVRHGNLSFTNPRMQVQAMDYVVSLTSNGVQRYMSPFTVSDSVALRGAALTLKGGDNQYLFFAGTTIPSFYLTLGATRDIGGFSLYRKQSDRLSFFATSSYINTPTDFLGLSGRRQNDYMQTAGLTLTPNQKWTLQSTFGASNHGGMGRAEADYIAPHLSIFVAGNKSASLFPLNQVFSLFSSTTAVKAGLTVQSSNRFTESAYYQHTITPAIGSVVHEGSSDYLSPSLTFKVNRSQDLTFNYTYSRNDGGFANQSSTGNRFGTSWQYRFTPRIVNSAEFIAGSVQDPLQLNSEDELTLREGITFPVKGGDLQAGFQHTRRNPSLVQKIGQELNLLSPALQQLYLQDPVSFVQSNNLPPEVKALLDAQVPINTSVSLLGQFRAGNRLAFNPNVSFSRSDSGRTETWTPFAGYSLIFQATRTLQVTSGLANVWVFNSAQNNVQRTTILSFGLIKRFSALPVTSLASHGGRILEGRVFRDNNVNGVFNPGEKGYVGVRVEMENGEFVLTDEQGRFRFNNVSGGEHTLAVDLAQFRGPVRMTTRSRISVDLIRERIAVIDFGIVDFARLAGNVYNDLRFDRARRPDSKGMPEIRMFLEGGIERRTIVTGGTGDYELDDVPPGDYTLTVDANSLPANYALPTESFPVHIAPVSTVVVDVPMRALRSIAGRVFLRVATDKSVSPADAGKLKIGGVPEAATNGQRGQQAGGRRGQAAGQQNPPAAEQPEFTLVPLSGVQLTAGYGVAKSDENGNFLLRDLPAGELKITLVPLKSLPEGMQVPSGVVRLPADPVQVQGATIVISNPDLVPYLVGKTAGQVRDAAKEAKSGARVITPAQPAAATRPTTGGTL